MRIFRTTFAATLSLMLLCACSQGGGASKSSTVSAPEMRRTNSTRSATLPDGLLVALEVATDDESRAQGLMFRESLASGQGMLFLFPKEGTHAFWMKNTLIPLDMIWLDPAGQVLEVEANVPPCPREQNPCPSYGGRKLAASVLELAAGEAAKHQVTVGSTVRLDGISELRVR